MHTVLILLGSWALGFFVISPIITQLLLGTTIYSRRKK